MRSRARSERGCWGWRQYMRYVAPNASRPRPHCDHAMVSVLTSIPDPKRRHVWMFVCGLRGWCLRRGSEDPLDESLGLLLHRRSAQNQRGSGAKGQFFQMTKFGELLRPCCGVVPRTSLGLAALPGRSIVSLARTWAQTQDIPWPNFSPAASTSGA